MKFKALLAVIVLTTTGFAALATQQSKPLTGTPVLWRDPGPIESRDLFWGSGSEAAQPKPPFTFIEENLNGTTPKVVVKDAGGVEWDVKLAGEESHGEVVANRLLWALGYLNQEMYFLHEGTIQGAKNLKRADSVIDKNGRFTAARFRRRDANVDDVAGWSFASNPFTGKQELSGLIILMALVNNWDTAEDKNQEVLSVKKSDGSTELWYVAQDLGASFGRFRGANEPPIKWNLAEYQKDALVQRVDGDTLILNYQAYGTPPVRIPLEHARWMANLLGRLTDAQIRAAFKAGGTSEQEIDGYVQKITAKINELRNAVGATSQ